MLRVVLSPVLLHDNYLHTTLRWVIFSLFDLVVAETNRPTPLNLQGDHETEIISRIVWVDGSSKYAVLLI